MRAARIFAELLVICAVFYAAVVMSGSWIVWVIGGVAVVIFALAEFDEWRTSRHPWYRP